jgi:TPR repeat protein
LSCGLDDALDVSCFDFAVILYFFGAFDLLVFWSSGLHSILSALNNLGICYELGRGGVGQDLTRASQLYARSASQGNPSAMNNWGFMLVKRAEVAGASRDCSNFRRAALLFRCAVQTDGGWPEEAGEGGGGGGGDFQAGTMSMTDFSHFFGGAGSSSSSSYHSHSAHSSAHGTSAHGTSSFRVATMTAMERRHRRTELRQTNADACFNLATLYEAGYGVERDLQAAYAYYRRAADNPDRPHPKAACRTASMLYSGTHKGETLKTETSRDKTARLAMALHYYKKGEWLRV